MYALQWKWNVLLSYRFPWLSYVPFKVTGTQFLQWVHVNSWYWNEASEANKISLKSTSALGTSAEIPCWWPITTLIWVRLLLIEWIKVSTNLKPTRSGYWIWVVTASTVLMEFLRSFVRRHFAGKPVEASRNVGCFSEARAKHDWWLLVTAFICNQGNRLLPMSASVTAVLYLLYSGKPL